MRKAVWLMRNLISIMPKLGYIVLRGTKDPTPAATAASDAATPATG
jgi:hypothetical protein